MQKIGEGKSGHSRRRFKIGGDEGLGSCCSPKKWAGDNNIPDFNGTSSLGLWTLEVYDVKKKKTGTLNSWSITVEY